MYKKKIFLGAGFILIILSFSVYARGQESPVSTSWILPEDPLSPAKWGIENGIVLSLWPTSVESEAENKVGGPRGLLRIGYNYRGKTYLVNFIAIEPVVLGKQEYSEISPSLVDNQWGKLIWAGPGKSGKYFPFAGTTGEITNPDSDHPEVEQLSFYLYIERFLNGASPYFKISIRSDRPYEIGIQVFNHESSAPMTRCTLTATMGNYSRLRLLHLKNEVVDARKLYQGYEGIDFVEKETYSKDNLWRDKNGRYMAIIESNESTKELSSWPKRARYPTTSHWRYRIPIKLTQYWKVDASKEDSSLLVRVNGRKKYWTGGSRNSRDYMDIPGGISFENFELRKNYTTGETYYFGLTPKIPEEFIRFEGFK